MAATSMFFGNFLYFNYYMIAAFKRRRWALLKYGVFIPFYWLMMSVANWIALWQIIIKPHYWEKTKHGLHLQDSEVLSGINQYLHLQKIEEKEQEMSVIAN
jgi:hypothetical protein